MNIYRCTQTLATFLILSSVLHAHEHGSDHKEPASDIIALSVKQIEDAKIESHVASAESLKMTLAAPAKVVLNEYKQALVVSKAPGIVAKIKKNIGDIVSQGESLATIESKEMAEAKAAYITALKRKDLAMQVLTAEETLRDKKISSEQDYKRLALASKEAQINLEMALQQLYILGLNEEDIVRLSKDELDGLCCYEIKAPMDGAIIAKDISLGARVTTDQEVYQIADLETVWVELGIYSKDLPRVKSGNKISIRSLKDPTLFSEAILTQLSPIVDEHTGTATAYATLPNKNGAWFPGTYVKADIIVEEVTVPVAVLKEAVHDIDGEDFVFVTHPEGFEKRKVEVGKSDGKYLEIIAGLDPGSSYASTNTFILKAEHGKNDAELD